jgi:hypothetical protein
MQRITKHQLQMKVAQLNLSLGRSTAGMTDAGKHVVGHIALDHNHIGYQLEEQLTPEGSVYNITNRMTAREMNICVCGMINGIALRNRQLNKEI